MTPRFRPIWLLLAALALLPPALAAQNAPTADVLQRRIAELERGQLELRNRYAMLEDRLNAVLGESDAQRVYEIPAGSSPVRGNSDAPVTLIVFGDYQSDYGARAQYALNRLLEAYPRELRLVYKQYPLRTQHPQAHDAALAAVAAGRQGRFWEMHELLFRNSRVLQPSLYTLLANQIGLDLTAFERDRTSLWALERLTDDEKDAVKAEVRGVPELYLNGRRLQTWRYDYLKAEVERLLRK
jgi:protein-disulfide isomerase